MIYFPSFLSLSLQWHDHKLWKKTLHSSRLYHSVWLLLAPKQLSDPSRGPVYVLWPLPHTACLAKREGAVTDTVNVIPLSCLLLWTFCLSSFFTADLDCAERLDVCAELCLRRCHLSTPGCSVYLQEACFWEGFFLYCHAQPGSRQETLMSLKVYSFSDLAEKYLNKRTSCKPVMGYIQNCYDLVLFHL